MDACLASGRFVTALSKRLIQARDKRCLFLFEEEIVFLHRQAESLGTSLKSFYNGALYEVKEVQIYSEGKDEAVEFDSPGVEKFEAHLRKGGSTEKRVMRIFRSGLRLPGSNHETTLGLTYRLSQTKDLALFETKLIQIYI